MAASDDMLLIFKDAIALPSSDGRNSQVISSISCRPVADQYSSLSGTFGSRFIDTGIDLPGGVRLVVNVDNVLAFVYENTAGAVSGAVSNILDVDIGVSNVLPPAEEE